jgi:predicted ribosome quality control (RQC) complex YloA/Tae2 family protein
MLATPTDIPTDVPVDDPAALAALRALLPARAQKAVVDHAGRAVLELYVHLPAQAVDAKPGDGVKRWLVVDGAAVRLEDARPARGEEGDPPSSQGLVRKEIVPSALTAVEHVDEQGLVWRFVFERSDQRPRHLVVERTAEARSVLVAVTDEGPRILGVVGGPPRASDGRDLRRGRLYEPPRAPRHAAARAPSSPASTKEPPRAPPALAEARAGLRAEAKRVRRLVDALERDLARHGDARAHEENGELLKTVLGQLKRGASTVDVWDFEGHPRTLALDPALDARQNLEGFFRRARRAREAAARIAPRLEGARARAARMEQLRAALGRDDVDASVIEDARAFLARPDSGGSPRRKAARGGRRQPWRAFAVGREGKDVVVRVGRGAKDNDALVKSARGNDLWLHARGHQGAHVIVPSSGGDVDPEVLLDAAHLAAHFSSARGERHVDVQTARVKHLKKLGPGAPAGLVHVTQETVVHLRVEEERTKRLLEREVAPS